MSDEKTGTNDTYHLNRRRTLAALGAGAGSLVGIGAFSGTAIAYPPTADWTEFTRTYVSGRSASAESVIQTRKGGFALAGWKESATEGFDFWLVKTDKDGDEEFNRAFGGTAAEKALSIDQTRDGGFALTGFTESFGAGGMDVWFVKTDETGSMDFTKTYGGSGRERAQSVVQTRDGGFALGGDTTSTEETGSDLWLIKTDSAGNEEFSQRYGGPRSEIGRAMIQTRDGGFALAGTTLSQGAGGNDFFLVKTDKAGNEEFTKSFGGSGLDVATALVQTKDGGFALAGGTTSFGQGGGDCWLVKTDKQGNEMFSMTYGGDDLDSADSLIQTKRGGFALAGFTESFGTNGSDILLVKTDEEGNEEFIKTFGGSRRERAKSLIQSRAGGYALAGGTVGAGGDSEMILLKTEKDIERNTQGRQR